MAKPVEFTLAPGVTYHAYPCAYRVFGTQAALVACGIADIEDFAVLPKRIKWGNGAAGFFQTKRLRGGVFEMHIDRRSSYQHEPGDEERAARKKLPWSECAWTPYRNAKTLAESVARRQIGRGKSMGA